MESIKIAQLMYEANTKIQLYRSAVEKESCKYKSRYLIGDRSKVDMRIINERIIRNYSLDFGDGVGGLVSLIARMEEIVYEPGGEPFRDNMGHLLLELTGVYKALFPELNLKEETEDYKELMRPVTE